MLEEKVTLLTNAVHRLADILEHQANTSTPHTPPAEAPEPETKPAPKKARKKPDPVAEESIEDEAPQAEPTPEPAPEPEASGLTVEDVRAAVAPLGREKGVALLKEYGATKLSDVDATHWPELVAKAKEQLEAVT